MSAFLIRRVGGLALTLAAGSLVVFLALNVLPGDPAAVMLGLDARPEALALLHHQLGLDVPAPLRYLRWLGDLLSFDLGTSYTYAVPVARMLADRALVTLPLAALTLLLSLAPGVLIGVAAAARQGRAADTLIMATAQLARAVPDFWLGMMLILVFSLGLRWFPAGGFPGWDAGAGPALRALLLPALALALPEAATFARHTRSAVLSAVREDFVRTARAKGLSRRAALWRHAVPAALVPLVTLVGIQFPLLLTGTIIIENVFNLPGLGRLVFEAITQRDLIVVQDLVMLLMAAVAVVNFAVDLLSARLDPRLGGAVGGRGGLGDDV